MPTLITASIDVTKLDKARFKTITRKNGEKAVFADLVLIHTPDGKYGDYMIKQSVTKEERAARLETPILGNGKTFDSGGGQRSAAPVAKAESADDSDSSCPF